MVTKTTDQPSMNEANDRDPFNNNSYGTLVDCGYKRVKLPILDVDDFNERIIRGYEEGYGEKELPADLSLARSLVPAGTATLRNFSNISPEIPEYITENCTGCMDCVTECPDTAILGKVLSEPELEEKLLTRARGRPRDVPPAVGQDQEVLRRRHEERAARRHVQHHHRSVQVQGLCRVRHRLRRQRPENDRQDRRGHGSSPARAIATSRTSAPATKSTSTTTCSIDMMLKEQTHLYVGGAGSCAGCGEGTALRMLCSATGSKYGDQWALVAATGCNTVYTSTYPYNPVPGALDQLAVRKRPGRRHRRAPALGPDGLAKEADLVHRRRRRHVRHRLPVAVAAAGQRHEHQGLRARHPGLFQHRRPGLDRQLHRPEYQDVACTARSLDGKQERRKEIAQIAMMHPRTFVAQTTCAHVNHFYKAVLGALEFDGPAIISCYTTCQPEHGVADNMASEQARLAVDTRAFPLLIYDPRKGDKIKERLSLQGNPAVKDDWFVNPKTKEEVTFIDFARSEGRFAKHFDKDGNPSETLLRAKQDRLENWHLLQELAGLR